MSNPPRPPKRFDVSSWRSRRAQLANTQRAGQLPYAGIVGQQREEYRNVSPCVRIEPFISGDGRECAEDIRIVRAPAVCLLQHGQRGCRVPCRIERNREHERIARIVRCEIVRALQVDSSVGGLRLAERAIARGRDGLRDRPVRR